MDSVPVALSVHHFVTSVGAYAGFAAFIALAVLTLLYFAQARETTSLRERGAELLDRVGQLEARLSRLSAQSAQAPGASAQAAVAEAPQAAPAAARLAALEMPPGAPAGVAAPALAAATRVIPAGIAVRAVASRAPVPAAAGVAAGSGVSAGAGVPVGAGAPAAAGGPPVTAPPPVRPAAGRPAAPGPAPATAAAGNGSSHGRVAPSPVRAGAAPTRASGARVAGSRPGGPAAPAARRPAARQATLPPERYDEPQGPHTRTFLLMGLAVLVIAGGAIAAILLTRSHGSGSPSSLVQTRSTPAHQPGVTLVKPSTVTVAVLNGTATAGLAHKTALQLTTAGFREGRVATASDQTHTATLVSYSPGARTEGLAVAKTLRLSTTSVRPIDPGTEAVACQGAPTCATTVVVTVGADLAGR